MTYLLYIEYATL